LLWGITWGNFGYGLWEWLNSNVHVALVNLVSPLLVGVGMVSFFEGLLCEKNLSLSELT